jgi:hypothetical protein
VTDRAYLERRAAQEAQLADSATNGRVAAVRDAMAATYFRELAKRAELEEQRVAIQRPPQL